jgi:hypothetical protein
MTLRNVSAMSIATSGGMIDTHPGNTRRFTDADPEFADDADKVILPRCSATISGNSAIPSASALALRLVPATDKRTCSSGSAPLILISVGTLLRSIAGGSISSVDACVEIKSETIHRNNLLMFFYCRVPIMRRMLSRATAVLSREQEDQSAGG